jgi:hypothetical protein
MRKAINSWETQIRPTAQSPINKPRTGLPTIVPNPAPAEAKNAMKRRSPAVMFPLLHCRQYPEKQAAAMQSSVTATNIRRIENWNGLSIVAFYQVVPISAHRRTQLAPTIAASPLPR